MFNNNFEEIKKACELIVSSFEENENMVTSNDEWKDEKENIQLYCTAKAFLERYSFSLFWCYIFAFI